MIHFIGLIIYIAILGISILLEAGAVLGKSPDFSTADWLYSALVVLCSVMPMPSWVLKFPFILILLVTVTKSILKSYELYTPTVARIDSGICLVLLSLALVHVIKEVIIPSL